MKCPRCNKRMVRKTIEGQDIEYCSSCRGLWLHRHQLNKLLEESGGDVEMCSIDHRPHSDKYPPIDCRVCTGMVMNKINFLEYSDIILDYCPSCGSFWLDKGELETMHSYIARVDSGAHEIKNRIAYDFLIRLSRLMYSIFH